MHSRENKGSRRQTFVKVLVVEGGIHRVVLTALLQELIQLLPGLTTAHCRENKSNNNPGIKERGEMDLRRGIKGVA